MLSSVWSLVRSLTNRVRSALRFLFALLSSEFTIVVDQQCGLSCNEVYEAAELYLRPKITPSTKRCRVYKTSRQKNINTRMDPNSVITDTYGGFRLKWKLVSVATMHGEKRFFELRFNQKFMEKVHNDYLPFVLAKSKEIKDNNKVVKLYTTNCPTYDDDEGGRARGWGSINLEHPFTFETLAMEVEMKNAIVEDLKRFVRRKEYYKKVGKAWKRGYLLYGPPGTGKSSLIAAMANYLKFDIYDVELTSLRSNSDFRRTLVSTTNRSIIVIEDIDCSPETQDRELQRRRIPNPDWTLSGLLNFMDGLWSSCGDERVIVFTTNHKDRLDPALLRPGRMDLHIHMSYCSSHGFRTLASTYLGIAIDQNHPLFGEIEGLIEKVKVTPAEIAGELMKSEDADIALAGLVDFLQHKMEAKGDTKEGEKTNITLQCNDVKEKAKKVENGGTEEKNLLYNPSLGHSWTSPSWIGMPSVGMPSVASQYNYELGEN